LAFVVIPESTWVFNTKWDWGIRNVVFSIFEITEEILLSSLEDIAHKHLLNAALCLSNIGTLFNLIFTRIPTTFRLRIDHNDIICCSNWAVVGDFSGGSASTSMEHEGELTFLLSSDTVIWVVNVPFCLEPMVVHIESDLFSKGFNVIIFNVTHNLVLVELSQNSLALPVRVIWLEWCA
jgi:hypothetical protein